MAWKTKTLAVIAVLMFLLAINFLVSSTKSTTSAILSANKPNPASQAVFKPHSHPLNKLPSILTINSKGIPQFSQLPSPTLPSPTWDEQIGTTFTQSFSSLSYNIIAVAQNGSFGYGPAYLLNGLTGSGYWYQVGLAYNWPFSAGGYNPGFTMVYDVFNNNLNVVLPLNGGGGLASFSTSVNPGDKIQLNLYFQNGSVIMSAYDWNTTASASVSFSAEGATSFIGEPGSISNGNGFFTGLMTEEYHVNQYGGSEKEVPYSLQSQQLSSAWQWADEWAPVNGSILFLTEIPKPLSFSGNPNNLQPFLFDGATEFSNATTYITGNPSVFVPIQNASINAGQNLNITSIAANGTSPYSYQWFEEPAGSNAFSKIQEANSSTLEFSTTQFTNAGVYKLVSSVTDSERITESSQVVNVNVINNVSIISQQPSIILPANVNSSNSLGLFMVHVSGTGFTPDTLVNFGYASNFPPYKNALIASTTDSNGNWSGSFSAPWVSGTYNMLAIDSNGITATALLVVASNPLPSGPIINLPASVAPSSSAGKTRITVSGTGFTPGALVNFGYASNFPPNSNAIVGAVASSSGNWTGVFSAPWKLGSYKMVAIDSDGITATASLVVTSSNTTSTTTIVTTIPRSPSILLPLNVTNSGILGNTKVTVSGTGFTPDTLVNFGYSPLPPFSRAIIAETTDSNGNWSGSFSAPWIIGLYNMTAIDADGFTTNASLVVK